MIRISALSALVILILASAILFVACSKGTDAGGTDRYNRGVGYLESGEYKNAITEFEAALRADPNNFEAMKNLGNAYVLDGNLQEALDSFKEARDMRPNDVSVYVNLAYVYQQMNEIELAWENIETARDIDPSYPLLHFRAGELFRAQGMDEQAIAAFSDYRRLEPDSRFAQDALAIINSLLLGNSVVSTVEGESLEELDEELEEEMTEGEELTEEDEEATEDEEVEEEEPEEEPEDEEPAEEAEEPENEEETAEEPEAEETVEEEADPTANLPDLEGDELYNDRLRRGRQMRAIGSTGAAINLLLQAYEVHPNYAQVNYELGMAYLSDGQTDTGVTYLERYLDLETDPALRAEVEDRIDAVQGTADDGDEGE